MFRNLFVLLAGVALAVGCGGGGDSSPSGTGRLAVRMADAPDPSVTSFMIDIDRIQANRNGRWEEVATTPQRVDLLDLVLTDVLLAEEEVPATRYNQVRLFVSDPVVTVDGEEFPVTIPSALNTGIKLNVNFDVVAGQLTELLLDFNVSKSLVKQGNGQYRLQPVIPVVVKVLSGTVSGVVTDEASLPLAGVEVKAVYKAGSSYTVGQEVNTGASLGTGEFKVWALLPGTYDLEFRQYDANDPTLVVGTAIVTDVEVQANQDTTVGTVVISAPPAP